MATKHHVILSVLLFLTNPSLWSAPVADTPRIVRVTATKNDRFQVMGQKEPVITLKAGEVIQLRVTAEKGEEWAKDGTVHSLTIRTLKDQGWDLRLKEGPQEFTLVAPEKPGEYLVECLVMCGKGTRTCT